MWNEAYDNAPRTTPPLRPAETDAPRALSEMLDARARRSPDAAAFYLRNPHSSNRAVEYLSLSFSDLVVEREAWLIRLIERRVGVGDRVLLAVPYGLEFLAAGYACIKLGADLVVLDPAASWKTCLEALRRLEPRAIIGSGERLKAAKRLVGGLGGVDIRIRVPDRSARIGAAPDPSSHYGKGANARIIFVAEAEGTGARAVRFSSERLFALARSSAVALGLSSSSAGLPTLPWLTLLYPAMGVATVVPSQDAPEAELDRSIDAISHLKLPILAGLDHWLETVLVRCQERGLCLPSVSRLVGFGVGSELKLCRLAAAVARKASYLRVYGAADSPLVATLPMQCDQAEKRDPVELGKGICLGRAAPEVEARIVPIDSRNSNRAEAPEKLETRGIGEIAVRGILCGAEVSADREPRRETARTRWIRTGDIGFLDEEERLWYCGRRDELVATSFGTFYPDRCQPVFEKHPRVERAVLVALRKDGKARPGIVVETAPGDLPKSKLELARFSAELLQLGKDLEEARLITEFFFVKELPELPNAPGRIDREALSARFSRKARF